MAHELIMKRNETGLSRPSVCDKVAIITIYCIFVKKTLLALNQLNARGASDCPRSKPSDNPKPQSQLTDSRPMGAL